MYIFDISKLIPGDIILQRFDGDENSEKIRQESGSNYSHALLYVGDSSVIEAGDTVEANNVARILVEDSDTVCLLRLKPEYFDDNTILNAIVFAREVVGMAYSVPEAFRVLQKPNKAVSPNRQICTRLVAQSFAKAGLKLVENPDYCTTKELEENQQLYKVKDFLKVASEEDIEFAESYNVLEDQADFTQEMLQKAGKLLGEDVQTIEQLSNMACKYPDKADDLVKIVKESGYLDLWKLEKDSHPWEYKVSLFKDKYKDHMQEAVHQTVQVNERLKFVYEQNLMFMRVGYLLYGDNPYLSMMEELYKTLINLCNQRSLVAMLAIR